MKEILKYSAAAAMLVLAMASCEEMPDYQTTIDAAPDLSYVSPNGGDTFSTLVVHRPTGSEGSFKKEFQINCNSSKHPEATVKVVYKPELVEEYNQKNGTSYSVLTNEYFILENDVVKIEADAIASADTVRIMLNEEAELSVLTDKAYLAPFAIESDDYKISESMNGFWFIVNTEYNQIRPIVSVDDMIGYPAGGTVVWTADCDGYGNLFDGSNSSYVPFSYSNENVLTIDMKEANKVTGIQLNTYPLGGVSIEYSEDGDDWKQAGTPVSGEYVWTGSSWSAGVWAAAVYDFIQARYIRLTYKMSLTYNGYNNVNEITVYVTDGDGASIYAVTGSDNVVEGKVSHKAGAESKPEFSASFNVNASVASEAGYTVSAAYDNSLVEAFNSKYGTSYKALPADNLSIEPASVDIASGARESAGQLTLSLTGDVSALKETDGYLAPVKLSSAGAETSASRGVVYAVIRPYDNIIKNLESADEIVGFPVGRSGWSAVVNGSSTANLFDNSTSTRVNLNMTGNELVIDMKGAHKITSFDIYGYPVTNIGVEYSLDGSEWKIAGTAGDDDIVFTGRNANSAGYTYVAFTEIVEASYLRLTLDSPNSSSSRRRIYEFNVTEVDGMEPSVYTLCGTDNVLRGKITHHVSAGSFGGVNASFVPMVTHSSESGYRVVSVQDNSMVAAYNAAHGTKYSELDPSFVEISGFITEIAAGELESKETVSVALKGNVSEFTDLNGYLIPVKLIAEGAVTSSLRGVVYVVVDVVSSDAFFMDGFAVSDINGSPVADRSGWTILACDDGGVHSGSYPELFDGNTTTYVRTWGGPVSFTVDLGQEYDMTGLLITARTDNSSYATYQPTSIQIMASLDGSEYTNLGTVSSAEGTIVSSVPTSYVSMYTSRMVRYLKIEAGYGSNMGTAEFNIYAK